MPWPVRVQSAECPDLGGVQFEECSDLGGVQSAECPDLGGVQFAECPVPAVYRIQNALSWQRTEFRMPCPGSVQCAECPELTLHDTTQPPSALSLYKRLPVHQDIENSLTVSLLIPAPVYCTNVL